MARLRLQLLWPAFCAVLGAVVAAAVLAADAQVQRHKSLVKNFRLQITGNDFEGVANFEASKTMQFIDTKLETKGPKKSGRVNNDLLTASLYFENNQSPIAQRIVHVCSLTKNATFRIHFDSNDNPYAFDFTPTKLTLLNLKFCKKWPTSRKGDDTLKIVFGRPQELPSVGVIGVRENSSKVLKSKASEPSISDITKQTADDEKERDKKEKKKPDDRSFVQKYWMYFVPFVIMMIFSKGEEPAAGRTATAQASSRQRQERGNAADGGVATSQVQRKKK